MANYFFIVGVGGAGRGVCNHLKYELEQHYGSLAAARTQVLVIDGPVRSDQYALPGGFEIDTNPQSPEFIQCHAAASPDSQIQAIAGGNVQSGTATEHIARWLPGYEAAKIPRPINPEGGFGGHRPSGHAYVYTDIARLRQSLTQAYQHIKQLQGAASQQGSRVLCFLVGSQSGGTGAGMLWDIAAMLRPLTLASLDSFYAILPLANSYHALVNTEERRQEVDAKNYAGLLNLLRFMTIGKVPIPVVFEYSAHDVFHNHTNIVECPFLLDGDGIGCKVNDIVPSYGVVPAIADWLMTLIKDDLGGTNHIAAGDSINWPSYIGADPHQMFAAFGTSTLRYPWQEVLQTFKYRFTWAVFEEMLKPGGPLAGEGQKRAQQVLGASPFGVMIERGSVDLRLQSWKTLRDQLRTHNRSRNKNRPLPVHEPPSEVVRLKTLLVFSRGDDEVMRDAEAHRNIIVNNVNNWINHQYAIIVADFQTDAEQVIVDLFMEKVTDATGQERYQPRTLGENYRNSIMVARDYLAYLRQKLQNLRVKIQQEFDQEFYPAGPNQPNLMVQLQARVQDKIRVMQASPGDHTDEQEDYLRALDRLLEAEVWHMFLQGLRRTVADVEAGVQALWDTIGDSAQGWCYHLDHAREAFAKTYNQDESRRLQWTQMRLRTYLPVPGSEAEDHLFAHVADPHLDSFFDQASWHLVINATAQGVERYELVLQHPDVEGSVRAATTRRTVLGTQVQVSAFNPDHLAAWAARQLRQPLASQTIWDIMELDFASDWLPKRGETLQALGGTERVNYEQQYVNDRINVLLNQSGSLWTLSGSNFQNTQHWGTWGSFVMSASPASIAERFSAELQKRGQALHPTNALPHEVRRAAGYFRAPLTAWNYHSTCYSHYLAYLQHANGILVDIYRNEQNAQQLRRWIQQYVDPSLHALLDVTLTVLLSDLEIFRLYALCYTLDLLPTRDGNSAIAPKVYYLGHTELASVLDLETLSCKILCTHFQTNGVWQKNDAVQQALRQLWQGYEAQHSTPEKIADWLQDLRQHTEALTLPLPPAGQPLIHREHLKKAFQAIVYHYIAEVKIAKKLE